MKDNVYNDNNSNMASKEQEKHLGRIGGIPVVAPCLQKAALLCTGFILRRILGISGLE